MQPEIDEKKAAIALNIKKFQGVLAALETFRLLFNQDTTFYSDILWYQRDATTSRVSERRISTKVGSEGREVEVEEWVFALPAHIILSLSGAEPKEVSEKIIDFIDTKQTPDRVHLTRLTFEERDEAAVTVHRETVYTHLPQHISRIQNLPQVVSLAPTNDLEKTQARKAFSFVFIKTITSFMAILEMMKSKVVLDKKQKLQPASNQEQYFEPYLGLASVVFDAVATLIEDYCEAEMRPPAHIEITIHSQLDEESGQNVPVLISIKGSVISQHKKKANRFTVEDFSVYITPERLVGWLRENAPDFLEIKLGGQKLLLPSGTNDKFDYVIELFQNNPYSTPALLLELAKDFAVDPEGSSDDDDLRSIEAVSKVEVISVGELRGDDPDINYRVYGTLIAETFQTNPYIPEVVLLLSRVLLNPSSYLELDEIALLS